jgi:hypothetical protein
MTRRARQRLRPLALIAAGVAALSACTVLDASPEQVVVQFNSYYPGWAFSQAAQHCSQFGRDAVLVASRPGAPSWRTGFTGTTIQTFDCVAPAPPQVEPAPVGGTTSGLSYQ